MKKSNIISILLPFFVLVIVSTVTAQDDLYFNPADELAVEENSEDIEDYAYERDNYSDLEDYDDYDGYYYTNRLRRFNRVYSSFGYNSPIFINPYTYGSYYRPGTSFYLGSPAVYSSYNSTFIPRYSSYYNNSFGFNSPYYSPYVFGGNAGFGGYGYGVGNAYCPPSGYGSGIGVRNVPRGTSTSGSRQVRSTRVVRNTPAAGTGTRTSSTKIGRNNGTRATTPNVNRGSRSTYKERTRTRTRFSLPRTRNNSTPRSSTRSSSGSSSSRGSSIKSSSSGSSSNSRIRRRG